MHAPRTYTHNNIGTYHAATVTIVLMSMAGKEKRSNIEADWLRVSPFFSITSGCNFFILTVATCCSTFKASSLYPFSNNHLGDSGTILYEHYC